MAYSYIDVFLDNLSPVYIFSIFGSIVVVLITVMFTKSHCYEDKADTQKDQSNFADENQSYTVPNSMVHPSAEGELEMLNYTETIPGKVKRARQKATEQEMLNCMSEEDKEHEEEVKKKQLEAIFALMKENEDKFGVSSEEDFAEQLHLYS